MKPTANILVVDDTPANLSLLCGMLKEQGYRVRPAPSGEFALKAAQAEAPDLILLDVSMPGMNGFEVCRHLKATPTLHDIPVLFISAHTETIDKVQAFSVGGVDYITKPFQFEEVQARVAAHLELRQKKRELEESYAKLTRMEELRDTLVHMLVHDLRSPLFAMCAFLEILQLDTKDLLPAASQEDLSEAIKAAKAIAEMINSVLDLSKLEADKLTLKPQDLDLLALAREVVRKFGALLGPRSLAIEHDYDHPHAFADQDLVSRVLQNLLANALKFTPKQGKITLRIEPSGANIRVSITDTGPGIPAEYHQKIFEKFGQAEAHQQKHPSTGLGLTFCKLAIEAHKGQIGVESEVGKGSTFWFTLPRP